MTTIDSNHNDLRRQTVRISGRDAFELIWTRRFGGGSQQDRVHGVISESVITDYANALREHFPILCGKEYQWPSTEASSDVCHSVVVKDLGPWIMGAALTDDDWTPYLALTNRNMESSPDAAARRRHDVVLHELVHLLQFQTATWRYWPGRNRWGTADPNWWLHEAVALAIESDLARDHVGWYPWLWTWAIEPQNSMESDDSGAMAAPFIQYLLRRFGRQIASEIYRITPEQVPAMRGTDLLNHVIAGCCKPENGQSRHYDLQSAFLDYCVFAGTLQPESQELDPAILNIVGSRIRTACFDHFPVLWSNPASRINHLGCRYFEFRLPELSTKIHFKIIPTSCETLPALGAELTEISGHGVRLRTTPFRRNADETGICCEITTKERARTALLTVANLAHGAGWALQDCLELREVSACAPA